MLTQLIGGALLGLAGALHCAAMCGGIGSGAALMFAPQSRWQTIRTIVMLSAGRITVYAALGGLVAWSADMALRLAPFEASSMPLQWVGAAALIGVGFSVAGLLPAVGAGGLGGRTLISHAENLIAPLRRHEALAPFGLGVLWGLAPCPLIYAALFTAGLTGSLGSGVLWMIGFGIGTLPALVMAMLGITWLSRFNLRSSLKIATGLSIVVFAVAALYLKLPIFPGLCT